MRRRRSSRSESGFALIAALVLLVLLSSIGAVMIRLSAIEQAGASLAILGARADQAARSGVEWAVHRAARTGSCPSATLELDEGVLTGFRVIVTCTASTHREGSQEITSLSIRSQASFGPAGGADRVFREIQAAVVP
ncbi:MAG TPA: hypothetical protein VKA74_18770 [Myxococcota bacterium]|nr:hypothetical protein [Myxococcota bacterium]